MIAAWAILPASSALASPRWPDTPRSRLAALAILEDLNGQLLSNESATTTLETWCDRYGLASPAKVVAERILDQDKPISDAQRVLLQVGPNDKVRYRRVRLRCGRRVLSEADNWYVPARLSPEMNETLNSTNEPFGRVVQGMHFQHRRLRSVLLWHPLGANWATSIDPGRSAKGTLIVPSHVIEHEAVLLDSTGKPFSEVVETYTADVLAFGPPAIAR